MQEDGEPLVLKAGMPEAFVYVRLIMQPPTLVIRPPPENLVYFDRQISADIVSVYFSASF